MQPWLSGKENRRCAVYSPYSVCLSGRGRACIPVSRQRLIDFQPEQGHCCNALIFSRTGFAVKKQTAEMVRCGQVRLKIADVFP
ncbi:hypothetical protein R1917_01415 [Citrobacter koseri]|uniref:hypothetical protein n=1 Tax=Citrobacter koseri TaxID=545 RepID=UPI002943A337|nr:hypothetical protein [Citrobacter koseri]WOJ31084.1 hypothetical protein R1917_01415 [Citrobacter koseri]WOJ35257.1 hypothetical protein R1243_22470 [Citrobacter koseri]